MGDLKEQDRELRRRIVRWLRQIYAEMEPDLGQAPRKKFAEISHISKSTITDALNGKEDIGIGLNVLVNMRRYLHVNINKVIDFDPGDAKATADPAPNHSAKATKTAP